MWRSWLWDCTHQRIFVWGYRVLNFVADLPVRVDEMLDQDDLRRLGNRAPVVFVPLSSRCWTGRLPRIMSVATRTTRSTRVGSTPG